METDRPLFISLYCRRRGIAPSAFARDLLLRSVYPHTRPLVTLLTQLNRGYFEADYEFIVDVGQLRRRTDFGAAAESYISHPANKGFIRRRLKLRISVRRMLELVEDVLPQQVPSELRERLQAKDSLTPFEQEGTQSGEEASPETE
jgi:hypothetical protein